MSTQLTTFEFVPPGRVNEVKEMFKKDFEAGKKHYTLMLNAYNQKLYYDIIKNQIPWVKAKKIDDRHIEVWISKPEN